MQYRLIWSSVPVIGLGTWNLRGETCEGSVKRS